MADLMQYVNRSEAPQNNQEMLTSYEWVLQFTHAPNIVFMPQDSIRQLRIKSVSINYNEQVNPVEATVRGGFKVHQPGLIVNSGTVTINYQDFEDQAMGAMCQDWSEKCNTRRTHRSAHKRDIYADLLIYRLNSYRVPVCKWVAETAIPATANYGDDTFDSQKSPQGSGSLVLNCEFLQKTLLNTI